VSDEQRFEELIAYLHSHLPSPVDQQVDDDDSVVLTGGFPPEVVVRLTSSSVVVSEYAGTWKSPDHFVVIPRRVGVVSWRRLPEAAVMQALSALIKGAREMRVARYRSCVMCDKTYPPEVLLADEVCPGCGGAPVVIH
jgi:hypothetical protein